MVLGVRVITLTPSSSRGDGVVAGDSPAEGVAHRLGDGDVHEAADHAGVAGEVHVAHVFGAAGHLARVLAAGLFHQHALHRAHHGLVDAVGVGGDGSLQAGEPCVLHVHRRVVGEVRRRGARAGGEDEGVALVEADIADQLHGFLEIILGFAGEAHDEIRRHADVRAHGAQLADLLLEFDRGVAALHGRQDAVGTGLHGQVQVVGQLRHAGIGLDQRIGELQRVRGGEADAADAFDAGDGVDQYRKIGFATVEGGAAVGVDVLAEQVHLAHALGGELGHFHQDVVEGAADFLAAGIGHHAVRAVLRAAFHDGDERSGPFGAGLGQAVEFLDLGEADVHLRLAGAAAGVDQLRQTVQGLRTEDEVHIRRARDDGSAFLRGHAAADADHHAFLMLFVALPAAELAEDFFLRLLADRAGVDQDDVGLAFIEGEFQAVRSLEHVGHLGRVVLVHLAAVGLDEKLAAHGVAAVGGSVILPAMAPGVG